MKQHISVTLRLLAVMALLCLKGMAAQTASAEAWGTLEVNTLTGVSGVIASGNTRISPVDQTLADGAALTIDGQSVGWSASSPFWRSSSVADGWHTAVLKVGGATSTKQLLVLNNSEVIIHTGALTEHETWDGGKTHVVRGKVTVPKGITLTIPANAVVKFCPEAKIDVAGTLNVGEAIFTALADDTYGGDTEGDGQQLNVDYTSYSVTGSGTKNLSAAYQCNGNEVIAGWSTPDNFANSMTVDAVLLLTDGTELNAIGSRLAFFDGAGNCRGTAAIRTTNWSRRVFSVQLWSDNATESGLTAKAWNAETNEVLNINGTFTFTQDTAYGSAMEPVVLRAGQVTVQWKLNSGWNWVSANVTPDKTDIADVLAGYTASNGDQIKTKDGYSTYYANYRIWDPSLTIVPGKMYAFQRRASGTATIEISGTPLLAENTLSLVAGWNWIGCFTDALSISVSALASTGGFSNKDQLKGKGSAYTTYYKSSSFSAWDGTLTAMTAGNGYKLYVAKAGRLSAKPVMQTRGGAAEEPAVRGGGCPWTTPDSYANSMTLDAVVSQNGTALEADGSAIGVFDANGVCRGVATIRTTAWGAVVYSGQIWSDSASEKGFTMKLYNGATQAVSDISETLDFAQDTAYGTAMEPMTLTAQGTDVPKPQWEYRLENGAAVITAYNGKDTTVTVPATLDGHAVAAVASGAFGANGTMVSVSLPISLKTLPKSIFANCTSLKRVTYTLDGVCMDFGNGIAVDVAGAAVVDDSASVTLESGWNNVAIPQSGLPEESRQQLLRLAVFSYDKATRLFTAVQNVVGGNAYWIYAETRQVIKVGGK